jgi:hypothetical protein
MIKRLLALRQRRESLAREEMLHRHAEAERATRQAQEAGEAVEAHVRQSAEAESDAFGSLVGRTVDVTKLYRLQGNLDAAGERARELRHDETRAAAARDERMAAFAAARDTHRSRLKAVMKLDELSSELAKTSARRRIALAELEDDGDRVSKSCKR